MYQLPKIVPPLDQQLSNESQRFWASVTDSIKGKRFTEATRIKQELEERQRQKATDRKEKDEEWRPRFFVEPTTVSGKPELTEDGKIALDGLQREDYILHESTVTGA